MQMENDKNHKKKGYENQTNKSVFKSNNYVENNAENKLGYKFYDDPIFNKNSDSSIEHSSFTIKLTPNPASDYFRINIPSNDGSCFSMRIINTAGLDVLQKKVNQNETINISNLSRGMCFVEINYQNNTNFVKLSVN